jgi:pimeloyl-ACP methyl ester carboxylesterase
MERTPVENRIHRAKSRDGTKITGRIEGQGPPLVLLPAGPADSETSWRRVLPFLRERFTCYLLNTRGRGLSADHTDHSPERLVEDIATFVESIGEPVGLVEWGSFVGASQSFAAARSSAAVSAIAAYEPLVLDVAGEQDAERVHGLIERVGDLAEAGRLNEAARTFVETWASYGYYTPEDMAGGATLALWETSAENIPTFLKELQQAEEAEGPGPTEPAELAGTKVPILLLQGSRTHPLHIDFLRHVARHVADADVREIPGAGHYGPYTEPEAVAGELTKFFEGVLEPAQTGR